MITGFMGGVADCSLARRYLVAQALLDARRCSPVTLLSPTFWYFRFNLKLYPKIDITIVMKSLNTKKGGGEPPWEPPLNESNFYHK